MKVPISLITWFCAGVALAGCSSIYDIDYGSDDSDSVPVPHNFSQINEQVFKTGCANFSVCHSAVGAKSANNLDLETDPFKALLDVAAVNAKAATEKKVRVAACDPDASILYIKLTLPPTAARGASGYGAHMPQNGILAPNQLLGIHDWIARGALPSEPDDASGVTCTK